MAKTDILDYSTTASENQDIAGISILGTAKPSNLDDGMRAQMAQIAKGLVSRRLEKDTAYTATKADHNQVIDFTEAATCTTQSASTLTDGWICYIYASGGDVTVNPNGSETVNGVETAAVRKGGVAILRVYNGNFLLNFFVGGGGSSDIIHEETATSLSSATTRDITSIAADFRAFQIEAALTGISSNPSTVNFFLSIGDGSTWFEISAPLVRWSNGGQTARYFLATIDNLDDADLAVCFHSHTSNELNDPFTAFVTPAQYPSRPITALRFRIAPPSGSTTVNIGKLKVTGIRS